MAILTYGSINIDHFYSLPHLPGPGETLASTAYRRGLGGKGANQSVAAARAGAKVRHLGAVGPDGVWALARLGELGVDCAEVQQIETPTGHALIYVDASGENQIVLYPGANAQLSADSFADSFAVARPGDTLLLQNEVTDSAQAAQMAQEAGLRVMVSAAPFDAEAVRALLPFTTVLALNAVEAAQLQSALGGLPDVAELLITRGAEGADLHIDGQILHQPASKVAPVDTTGAGDTFAGYYAAGRDEGLSPVQALRLAAAASAVKVTRAGTADAIPDRAEVEHFMQTQPAGKSA